MITKRILQSMRKVTMAFLVLVLFVGVTRIGGTNAGFSDIEESTGNSFTAASLDGRVSYLEQFLVTGMTPEDNPSQNMTFKNEGGLDFQYQVKYRNTGGDMGLCSALLLTAKRGGTVVYDKLPLKDFDSASIAGSPYTIPVFGQDKWNFALELPADAGGTLENKNCSWNFDLHAWQTNLPDDGTGFVDTETAGVHSVTTGEWLTAGDVVLNEVMWMGSTVNSHDEWIELRNMTGSAIPIAGWKIENASSVSGGILTIPSGKFIPAHGYFLIANYEKTDANSALDVAPDWVTTNVELNNTGNGNLVLKSNTNLVIDSALGAPNWAAGNHGSSTPFEQSMERNDIPGDGLLVGSWHACVSGAANGAPYWDAVGNNYGTPKAANLSPIVLNEFVPNPIGEDDASRPNGEWIELYNILDTPIDVTGWYITNAAGDQIVISAANTESGDTLVPGHGQLVVYLEQKFLDNDADTLSLYNPLAVDVATDDVREDTVSYTNAGALPEGKSFARFPDGEGIWIDPEATPGKENAMNKQEMSDFQLLTFDTCFENEKLKKGNREAICSPVFLLYLGMLKEADDQKINDDVILGILDRVLDRETKKLAALLQESGASDETVVQDTGTVPSETEVPVVTGTETSGTPDTVAGSVPEEIPVAKEEQVIKETPTETTPSEVTAGEEPKAVDQAPPADVVEPVVKEPETAPSNES